MSRTRLGLTGLASSLLLVVGLLGLVAAPASASTEAAPVRHSDCTTPLTSTQRAALLQASDTRTLRTFADAKARLDVIESTFSATRDHRDLRDLLPPDPREWRRSGQRRLAVAVPDLGRARLAQLRGRLSRQPARLSDRRHDDARVAAARWPRFNRLVGRVAAEGLIAHLVIDFPRRSAWRTPASRSSRTSSRSATCSSTRPSA